LTFRRSRPSSVNTRYIRSKTRDNNASLTSSNGIKGLRVAMKKIRKDGDCEGHEKRENIEVCEAQEDQEEDM
jgi:riboflavin synthase